MDEKSEREIKLLQATQKDLVSIFEKHVAKEISRGQMYIWLTQNVGPLLSILGSRKGGKPGLWLIYHAHRMIRSYISDIEDPTYPRDVNANLEWYWEIIQEYFDYLTGEKIYRTNWYYKENPLGHRTRKNDEWMTLYLEQLENCVQTLASSQEVDFSYTDFSEIENKLGAKPLSLWTMSEYLMHEAVELIKNYDALIRSVRDFPELSSLDVRAEEESRLRKLIQCYKGESFYSMTVTFEGLDKFSVTIFLS